ncbi:MFS transporter [Hirschia litorea]|uniref:MFS transporter n=1 Tax=Hirschia litorea TaxID=1199156 RepID=A0ABW2IP92_9PROT
MKISENRAILSAMIVAFGGFIFGLDIVLISGGIAAFRSEFLLNDAQVGWVVSAAGWGVLPVLLLVGPLTNKIGRKNTLIVIAAMYIVSAVGSVLATNWVMLAVARALGGMAFTSLSVAAMYIGEVAPPNARGKMVSINQLNIGIGITVAFLVNLAIASMAAPGATTVSMFGVETGMWRWMLGVEIIPAIIWLVLLLGIPKSPRWLYSVGREAEARDVLAKMMPGEHVDAGMEEIRASAQGNGTISNLQGIKELFSTHLSKALFVGVLVAVLQPLTGINNLLYYAPIVFEQAGAGTNAAFISSVGLGVLAMAFTAIAIVVIDRVGRRPLLIGGLAVAAACMLIAGWSFSQAHYMIDMVDLDVLAATMPTEALKSLVGVEFANDVAFKNALVDTLGFDDARKFEGVLIKTAVEGLNAGLVISCILGFVAAFNISIGPIMWVLFSEIFPTRVRGVAISACALVTSLVSAGAAMVFPVLLSGAGAGAVFLLFGVIIVVGAVLIYMLVPETKNKTIEQIEATFKGA